MPQRRTGRARLLGALGMLALTVTLFWLVTDEGFRVTAQSVTVSGIEFADEQEVRAHLSGIARSPNVFRVRASDLVSDGLEIREGCWRDLKFGQHKFRFTIVKDEVYSMQLGIAIYPGGLGSRFISSNKGCPEGATP